MSLHLTHQPPESVELILLLTQFCDLWVNLQQILRQVRYKFMLKDRKVVIWFLVDLTKEEHSYKIFLDDSNMQLRQVLWKYIQ